MDIDLTKIKKIFFIGIGGIGISALAKMALARGMEVFGVNDEESPKTLEPLRQAGVQIFDLRIVLKEVPKDGLFEIPEADLYVYSDAWIYRGPEIIESAKKRGRLVLSYFEALGIFAKEYKVIAIAGTHGKTTTTAMVAEILVDAGLDPTVVVGSFVQKFDSNFRAGKSKYLVVEADEYNRHFLNFNPFVTVVTNIEADHLDYFKDLSDIQDAFKKLISQTQSCVVYNSNDTNTHVLVHGYGGRVADYKKYLEKVPKLSVPGEHNRMNAAAALAVADIFKIPPKKSRTTLAEFSGTWRRLEKKEVTKNGTIIYDDYAHHPTEIKASIQALRELYFDKKITIVFQPHLYSRTKALFNDFAKSFKGADNVFLLPIYFAREDPDPSVSSEKLAEAIRENDLTLALSLRRRGENVRAFPDFPSASEAVRALNLGRGDVFVTMGAGEAYKVADGIFKFS